MFTQYATKWRQRIEGSHVIVFSVYAENLAIFKDSPENFVKVEWLSRAAAAHSETESDRPDCGHDAIGNRFFRLLDNRSCRKTNRNISALFRVIQ